MVDNNNFILKHIKLVLIVPVFFYSLFFYTIFTKVIRKKDKGYLMKTLSLLYFLATSSLSAWEITIFYSQAGNPYSCNLNDLYEPQLKKDLQSDLQEICDSKEVDRKQAKGWKDVTIVVLEEEMFKQKEVYIGFLRTVLHDHCRLSEICKDNPMQWAGDILEALCYRLFGRSSIASEKYVEPYEEEYEQPVPVRAQGKEREILDSSDEDKDDFLEREKAAQRAASFYSSLASTEV